MHHDSQAPDVKRLPLPWIKLSTDHILMQLGRVPCMARGIAITLYAHIWSYGEIEADNEIIAIACGCSEEDVAKNRKHLAKLFDEEDGVLRSNYLEAVRTEQDKVRDKRAYAGSRGGRPRKTEVQPDFEPDEKPNALQTESKKKLVEESRVEREDSFLAIAQKESHMGDEKKNGKGSSTRKPKCLDNPEDDDPAWLAFVRAYPKRSGAMKRPDARRVWKILAEHEDVMQIVERAEDYARHIRHVQKEGTQYVMQMTTFLNGEWRQDWNASLPYDLQRIETPDGRTMIRKDYDRECAIR